MCFRWWFISVFQSWWGFPADHKTLWLGSCLGCLLPGELWAALGVARTGEAPWESNQLLGEQSTLVSPLGQPPTILVASWPAVVPGAGWEPGWCPRAGGWSSGKSQGPAGSLQQGLDVTQTAGLGKKAAALEAGGGLFYLNFPPSTQSCEYTTGVAKTLVGDRAVPALCVSL